MGVWRLRVSRNGFGNNDEVLGSGFWMGFCTGHFWLWYWTGQFWLGYWNGDFGSGVNRSLTRRLYS